VSHDIGSIIRDRLVSIQFQPIIDVRGRTLLAYEALARGPSNGPLHAPLAMFAAAASAGVLPELELVCLRTAFERTAELRLAGRLFVNVSPHSLLSHVDWRSELEQMCRRYAIEPGTCVIELTEQTLVKDFDDIRETLHALRASGFDLAIDDFGTGHSGLRMWSELRPDFVKIDRYFANSVDRDPVKLEFVRSIIEMGRAVGSRVIIEGIETIEECRELIELEVDGFQGFLFGRPETALRDTAAALAPLEALRAPEPPATAGNLLVDVAPVRPTMRVSEFVRLVQQRAHCAAFPVVDDAGMPVGMIWRDRFLVNYSKPLHPEVLAKKPVSAIMDPAPLIVDSRLRLEQTSRLVTRKSRMQGTDQFIIVRDGVYAGIGHTIDLLTHITESRIQAATHSNPLTALPGNLPIRDNITRVIQQGRPFVVCYVDLDHFKPFNDHYGYVKGDQALLQLAQVLVESVARRTDFVGHIGGDDFIMVLRSPDWAPRLVRLVDAFMARVRGLYAPEDAERGGIEAPGRHGEPCRIRMLSLSVAIVDSRAHEFRDSDSVAQFLQVAKRRAKAVEGNCLWYEGPDGSRNLLADPGILANIAPALPIGEMNDDIGAATYPPLSVSVA
jgi:EAL domain-containing protein (putative c-di-GMP-specific phosphodiesterase class I)/GGDEF domain-containing protein